MLALGFCYPGFDRSECAVGTGCWYDTSIFIYLHLCSSIFIHFHLSSLIFHLFSYLSSSVPQSLSLGSRSVGMERSSCGMPETMISRSLPEVRLIGAAILCAINSLRCSSSTPGFMLQGSKKRILGGRMEPQHMRFCRDGSCFSVWCMYTSAASKVLEFLSSRSVALCCWHRDRCWPWKRVS